MNVVGLMSGTSADGIDAALIEVESTSRDTRERFGLQWRLRAFVCVPYPDAMRTAILDSFRSDAPIQTIVALNALMGQAFAGAARQVCEQAAWDMADVDIVASHGQTVWHQPNDWPLPGIEMGGRGTLQIGESAIIAAETGCLVVSDFRAADMALGGQGAPLVPFADWLLLGSAMETRAIQNIGGIANVTLLPGGAGLDGIRAFDTGPGNMVLDGLIERITQGRERRDEGGERARQGRVSHTLLGELLQHPFFAKPPPKSTGREEFGGAYCDALLARSRSLYLTDVDILATAVELTVESIALAYETWLQKSGAPQRAIVGGGGTANGFLMERLRARLAPMPIQTHEDFGISNDAKEAIAFALLGWAYVQGISAGVPSVTGAGASALLGKITLPPQSPGSVAKLARILAGP